MMRLIRRTLIWVLALVLLVLVRSEQSLTAQSPWPPQDSELPEQLPSFVDAPPLALMATASAGYTNSAGEALWIPRLFPAAQAGEDALWALQGTGCDSIETVAYEPVGDWVHPFESCIHLEKTGPASARPGEVITYDFTVTNCGNVPLSDVWVVDYRVFGCAKQKVGPLQPGESYSLQAEYVVPVGWCGDLVNSASAGGRVSDCSEVCDRDSWVVEVACPPGPTAAIEVVKDPQVQTVEYGASATFTITVTNAGEVDLDPVVVDDPRAPECNRTIGPLPIGSILSYQCTVPSVTLPFTNVIVATATAVSGEVVSDEDEARVLVAVPAIAVSKSPDPAPVERGGIVTFTVALSNSGDVPLGAVVVRDPLAPDCDRALGALPQGTSIEYQCVSPPVTTSFTNTVSVTATTPAGAPVTALDQARVVVGALSIEKYLGIGGQPEWQEADSPPGPPVFVGTPIWFWLMVRNSGDAELSDLVLTDSALDLMLYPECTAPPTLAPGAPFDCVVGPLSAQEGQHADTAQITGEFAGKAFAAQDRAHYLGYDGSGASIDIEKYIAIDDGEWQDADSIDAAPEVPVGPDDASLIQFRFAVMNTGAAPLNDVLVTDTDLDLSSCAVPPSPLAPGATYECIVQLPRGLPCLQTNVATARGYYNGLPYSDTDAVHYFGVPCFTPTFYRTFLPIIVR